jgi:hypothetical protein
VDDLHRLPGHERLYHEALAYIGPGAVTESEKGSDNFRPLGVSLMIRK